MKYLVSGHRLFKLKSYDIKWIQDALREVIENLFLDGRFSYGLSGMASGVDLWFCQILLDLKIQYTACIPFDNQEDTMDEDSAKYRDKLLSAAGKIMEIRNSGMINIADAGIIVWDGNKGGTHNVFQQMIEKNKHIIWINPVGKKVWDLV